MLRKITISALYRNRFSIASDLVEDLLRNGDSIEVVLNITKYKECTIEVPTGHIVLLTPDLLRKPLWINPYPQESKKVPGKIYYLHMYDVTGLSFKDEADTETEETSADGTYVVPKVYYAHSMSLYGTPQETRDIELLESMGYEVINPSEPIIQEAFEAFKVSNPSSNPMDFFRSVVGVCDALAFRSFLDGKIGAGVWAELQHANSRGIPVVELPNLLPSRGLSVEETRMYLSLSGQR